MRSVSFENVNEGWVVGDEGSIYKTQNGGLNWTLQSSGVIEQLYSVNFVDTNIGFVVGEGGRMLKTSNGGTNWVIEPSGTESDLTSVEFFNSTILTPLILLQKKSSILLKAPLQR